MMDPRAILEEVFDHLRGAWRFRWIALAIAWVLSAVAWAGICLIPDHYLAAAKVLVDTRTTLREVTRGISVESNIEAQIQQVREAILGAPQMEQIAAAEGLLKDAHTPAERQAALKKFRERLTLSGSLSNSSAGLFEVSYKHRDRQTALNVVKRLLNTFVDATVGGKREGSQQAEKFLIDQIAEYETRLNASEERLAKFKKDNVGLMPGAQGDYFARLQGQTDELQKAQTTLNIALQRRDALQRQLHGEQPLLAIPSTDPSKSSGAPAALGGDTASRIRETQQRLDELLLRFTDKHPDVVALRSTLAELQQRQRTEIAAAQGGDAAAAALTGLSANPVYQNIQLQSNQTDVDIAALRADVADREKKVAAIKGLVNTAPEVEAELSKLNRDYDVTRAEYHSLLERLDRIRLGEDADSTGIVRFEVIEPPSASTVPVEPNRPLLIAAAFIGSIAVGIAVAALLHLLNPVFNSARQLRAGTGLPVLGIVAMTGLDQYRANMRRRAFGYSAVAVALVVATGAMLALNGRISQVVQQGMQHESR